jgi:uncharacterized membrane protein YoaK (UPF0700 family)
MRKQVGHCEPSNPITGDVTTPELSARSYRAAPVLLGFVAGYVDGCTFVTLFGLFVAQVTGSFVIGGAILAVREYGALIKVLAIPVFLLGGAVATALVSVARHAGWRASTFVLGLESLLLAGLLFTLLMVPNLSDPDQPTALAAGLFGLSAMGVQSAFVRLLMRGTPSTNVMTTNTTQVAIDATEILLARLWTSRSAGFPTCTDIGHARKRLAETVPIMLAFLGGTAAGQGAGVVCLMLPVAMLAGLAMLAPPR